MCNLSFAVVNMALTINCHSAPRTTYLQRTERLPPRCALIGDSTVHAFPLPVVDGLFLPGRERAKCNGISILHDGLHVVARLEGGVPFILDFVSFPAQ